MKILVIDNDCDRGIYSDRNMCTFADNYEQIIYNLQNHGSWNFLKLYKNERMLSENIIKWILLHLDYAPKEIILGTIDPLEEIRIRVLAGNNLKIRNWYN